MKLLCETAGLLCVSFFSEAEEAEETTFVVSTGSFVSTGFSVAAGFSVPIGVDVPSALDEASGSEVLSEASEDVSPAFEIFSFDEFSDTLSDSTSELSSILPLVSSVSDTLLSVIESTPNEDKTPSSSVAQPANTIAAVSTAMVRIIIDLFIVPLSVVILKQPSRMRAVIIR